MKISLPLALRSALLTAMSVVGISLSASVTEAASFDYDAEAPLIVSGEALALPADFDNTVSISLGATSGTVQDVTWDFSSEGADTSLLDDNITTSCTGTLKLNDIGSVGTDCTLNIGSGTTVQVTGTDATLGYKLTGEGTLSFAGEETHTYTGKAGSFDGKLVVEGGTLTVSKFAYVDTAEVKGNSTLIVGYSSVTGAIIAAPDATVHVENCGDIDSITGGHLIISGRGDDYIGDHVWEKESVFSSVTNHCTTYWTYFCNHLRTNDFTNTGALALMYRTNRTTQYFNLWINNGTTQGGRLAAGSLTLGGDSTFNSLSLSAGGTNAEQLCSGALYTNGNTVTLLSDSSMRLIDEGTYDHATDKGKTSLIISGGTTQVTVSDKWTNLKSLALSEEARMTFGASVSVAEDISIHDTATGTLAEGTQAGLEARYCVYAGGSINLAGNLKAGAYVEAGGDISVGGLTTVGQHMSSTNGSITLTGGGSVAGLVTAKSLSVGAASTFNQLAIYGDGAYDGALNANGHTVTLTGDSSTHVIDSALAYEGATGISTIIVEGGTTEVRTGTQWTNLKELALSQEARMVFGASVNVSGNITTAANAVGTLADGRNAGLEATYCIKAGTMEDGSLKEGTGDVTLSGNLMANNAYMDIMGNVNVSKVDGALGNVSAGTWLTVGGNARVEGNISANEDITIGGVADIAGDLRSQNKIFLNQGGSIGGTTKAWNLTTGGDTSFNQLALDSALYANGNKVTFTGDSTLHFIDKEWGENEMGVSSIAVAGGTTDVRLGTAWTCLKSLDVSSEGRFTVGASVAVAENISSTTEAAGTLAEGTKAGVSAWYCIKVGTEENGQLKEGTGNVTLAGELTARNAYLHIMGDASVSKVDGELGNLSAGTWLTVGGNATVAGSVSAVGAVEIGGVANIGGDVTSSSGDITFGGGGTVGGQVTAAGMVTIGGNAHNMSISAASATVASADGSEIVLDAVDFALVTGHATLGNVRLTGDSSIRSTADTPGMLTFERLTLVLDNSNSALASQAMALTLGDEDVVEGLSGAATFGIQAGLLDNVALSEGGELVIDLSYWEEQINSSELENLTLTFADNVDLSAIEGVQVTLDGEKYATASMVDGNVATFALPIPEPTTATLSLLALTALAARRRRK